MDTNKYTTLLDAMKAVPDPRKACGKRHSWPILLSILVSGLASGFQTVRAIAHWSRLHAVELQEYLQVPRLPSESTLLRALSQIDSDLLDKHIQTYVAQNLASAEPAQLQTTNGTQLRAQAIDGKTIRGANAHGKKSHLVSQVDHGSGTTRAQVEVAEKSNEIPAVETLLKGQDLSGLVLTFDALLTQKRIATCIVEQQGDYLMMVKKNQPHLYEQLDLFFAIPPIPADAEAWQTITTHTKGHGRLETRTVRCGSGMEATLEWPGARQIIRRTTIRLEVKTGKQSEETVYGITSLPRETVGGAEIETLWRGHWTIENRKHYVRDVTMGEDRNQMRTGRAPRVMATLRSGLIDLWRHRGWKSIAEAIRSTGASVHRALSLIGAIPATLT
jgi:predicted transposase YbfD/YdcC